MKRCALYVLVGLISCASPPLTGVRSSIGEYSASILVPIGWEKVPVFVVNGNQAFIQLRAPVDQRIGDFKACPCDADGSSSYPTISVELHSDTASIESLAFRNPQNQVSSPFATTIAGFSAIEVSKRGGYVVDHEGGADSLSTIKLQIFLETPDGVLSCELEVNEEDQIDDQRPVLYSVCNSIRIDS